MKVSVITASRLQVNPSSETGRLYVGRALQSAVDYQTADVEIETVMGLDPGCAAKLPSYLVGPRLKVVEADRPGQAAAFNAAVQASTGDVLVFIEDDDVHVPHKLALQLDLLHGYDLVTSVQREVDEAGNFLRVNEFPCPSTWLLRRELWDRVGPYNEAFRFHVDTEWLGRANAIKIKRVHLTPEGHSWGPWLYNVAQFSQVYECRGYPEPLVNRTENSQGGMMTISRDKEAAEQSKKEHQAMFERWGHYPW